MTKLPLVISWVLTIASQHVRVETDSEAGIGAKGFWDQDLKDECRLYLQKTELVHKEPFYTSFINHPALAEFVKSLMGWPSTLLLKRTVTRANVPGAETTGVHYDQLFLRGGDPENVCTAWVPLGDIPVENGGLIYLSESVQIAKEIEAEWARKAAHLPYEKRINAWNEVMGAGTTNCSDDAGKYGREVKKPWIVADYEAGDIMFHSVSSAGKYQEKCSLSDSGTAIHDPLQYHKQN